MPENPKSEIVNRDSRFPWEPDPVTLAMPSWLKMRERYMAWMRDHGLLHEIDEIALLFGDRTVRDRFVLDAVKGEGITIFNSAHDRVRTKPLDTNYGVEYVFLRQEQNPMRVEAMLLDGNAYEMSPLHEAMLSNMKYVDRQMPRAVHLSFKVQDKDEYEKVMLSLSRDTLAQCTQECESTYGKFSYWKLLNGHFPVYLKPRVNRRDAAPETVYDADDDERYPVADADLGERGEFGMPGVGGSARGTW